VNGHFAKLISECHSEYSSVLNEETNSFGVKWQQLNPSFTPNSSYLSIYNSFQFMSASQLNSNPYIGKVETYSGGAYVFNMIGDKMEIVSNL
jgi:hypothetical protein